MQSNQSKLTDSINRIAATHGDNAGSSGAIEVTSLWPRNIRDYSHAKSLEDESPAWQSSFSTRNRRDRLWSNASWSTTRPAAHACSSRNSFSFPRAWRSCTARRENAAGWCGNAACASAWHSRQRRLAQPKQAYGARATERARLRPSGFGGAAFARPRLPWLRYREMSWLARPQRAECEQRLVGGERIELPTNGV